MRRRLPPGTCQVVLVAITLAAAGCSTGGSDSISTSSLAPPRPEHGLRQDAPRYNTVESESPKPYTQPDYIPGPYQRPSYAQQQPAGYYRPAAQAPYAPPPAAAYAQPRAVPQQYANGPYGQPGTYQPSPYQQAPYQQAPYPQVPYQQQAYQQPQQGPYQAQPQIQTGSLNRQAPYGYPPYAVQPQAAPGGQTWQASPRPPYAPNPLTTGSITSAPGVVEVREGDTLYSISRRTGVPVADIVSANRIAGGKIQIGQKLAIPARSTLTR